MKEISLLNDASYLHVAITYDDDHGSEITKSFEGDAKACEIWLNSVINEDDNMLICLDFDNPSYDWHTIDELEESGDIEVKNRGI